MCWFCVDLPPRSVLNTTMSLYDCALCKILEIIGDGTSYLEFSGNQFFEYDID